MELARWNPLQGSKRSIRRFLLAAIALVLGLLTLMDAAIEYRQSAKAMTDARDRALSRIAASYLRALRAQDADASRIPPSVFQEELGARELPRLRFRVSDDQGRLLGGDASLRPTPQARQGGLVQPEVYDDSAGGTRLRVAFVRDDLLLRPQAAPMVVQVAEPLDARSLAERQILLDIGVQKAARLAIVVTLIWLVIWLGLHPLEALQQELKNRRPQDLTLVTGNRPQELAPLVTALNELLQAQQASIDQQRKFLTDASHQLRTPIAVLRTLVQGTLFGQTPATDSLPRMLAVIERATGLTNQLLSMAKTEQLVRRGDWRDVDLEHIAREVAVEFAPLIARKRLDFSLQATSIVLQTDGWMLGELIKNLLSNAIHHSRKGGALGIVVRELRHETEMIVWDHGGGVDEDVLARLFEPFNVAKGGTGIGLGLSICRQIAESMNATVDLFNRIEAGEVIGVDAVVRWTRPAWPAEAAAKEPALHA